MSAIDLEEMPEIVEHSINQQSTEKFPWVTENSAVT